MGDAAATRRGHFHDGFVSFNRYERLISDDVIALVYVPGHDLGFFEPFTEIGQIELAHTRSVQPSSQALRAAVTMRATEGI